MNNISYKDFQNICRTCLLTCDNKLLQDHVISDVYYKLTEIRFDFNNELPQQICLKCYEKIIETHAFLLQCKQAHSSLIKCLNEFKNIRIKEEIQETSEFEGIKEEITIEEHNIEFVGVNELYVKNDNLQIKQEIIEETNDELKSKTDDENIVSDQDDFNEFVVSEETSQDKTIINNLNEDTNSDRRVKRPLICKVCHKTFICLSKLNRHKLIHSGERPYACETCNKRFTQSIHLKEHKRIHSGVRPYVCDVCDKAFVLASYLNKHKHIHSGERLYVCELCNKTFISSDHLNSHKRVHSNERSYACEICNKAFLRRSQLIVHKRKHSGEGEGS